MIVRSIDTYQNARCRRNPDTMIWKDESYDWFSALHNTATCN